MKRFNFISFVHVQQCYFSVTRCSIFPNASAQWLAEKHRDTDTERKRTNAQQSINVYRNEGKKNTHRKKKRRNNVAGRAHEERKKDIYTPHHKKKKKKKN